MKALMVRRVHWGAMALSLLVAAIVTLGQMSAQAQDSESKPMAKSEKKLSGRLPPYYGEVVSKDQRTQIYQIQAKYAEQLKKLREQIQALEMQQQEEVAGVLSPQQREQIAKRVMDAKAKRAKREPSTPPVPAESAGQ